MSSHEADSVIAGIGDAQAHGAGGFPEVALEAVATASRRGLTYSICTCVTRPSQYAEMVASFQSAGFGFPDAEFLYVDNSTSNGLDAFAAYNLFLRIARGRYVVLCHQDIVLRDDRTHLDRLIADIELLDPQWAVLGNAGGVSINRLAIRISDRWGENARRGGPFPARVSSLDENFIIVRGEANLALSSDLRGFHLYGTDICLIADLLGYHAYVIDFHVWHKGEGTVDEAFWSLRKALIVKYRRAFRARAIATTCTNLVLTSCRVTGVIANTEGGQRAIMYFLRSINRARKILTLVGRVAGFSPGRHARFPFFTKQHASDSTKHRRLP